MIRDFIGGVSVFAIALALLFVSPEAEPVGVQVASVQQQIANW